MWKNAITQYKMEWLRAYPSGNYGANNPNGRLERDSFCIKEVIVG